MIQREVASQNFLALEIENQLPAHRANAGFTKEGWGWVDDPILNI
jgi:hypothetical protein